MLVKLVLKVVQLDPLSRGAINATRTSQENILANYPKRFIPQYLCRGGKPLAGDGRPMESIVCSVVEIIWFRSNEQKRINHTESANLLIAPLIGIGQFRPAKSIVS